ncbi:MAG: hypothetical protein GY816_17170 [Cytophagales bacterium]|nr:hypothetical protein [Cytophagales bacterium]
MSNSRTLRTRKDELAQKEKLLLAELNVSKAKKVALWSLGAGVVSLIGYGVYKYLSTDTRDDHPSKRKVSKKVPKDSPIVDSAIKNLGPNLGKWLLKQLGD